MASYFPSITLMKKLQLVADANVKLIINYASRAFINTPDYANP